MLAASMCLSAAVASVARAADVVRTPLPDGGTFPISLAVTVPADDDTVYVSGQLPDLANKDAPKGSVEAFGNMETQTVSVMTKIKAALAQLGLTMGDVVKMTVFMVADPTNDNKLNFPGLMAGYSKFFGTAEQPNKPARSAVQVAALVAPGALLEVEVIAAKPHTGPNKSNASAKAKP
jgi:enamine deaminase RidA (YjgF/YER057c/UK114 family)